MPNFKGVRQRGLNDYTLSRNKVELPCKVAFWYVIALEIYLEEINHNGLRKVHKL